MANVIHSTLTYNANLGPAQAQIKALTGQIGTLTAAFNVLDKAALKTQASLASTFMANVGQIGGFTSQIVQSSTAVNQFGQAIAKQRLTMRQYFREAFAGYTKQNSMMKQLAAQQVRMQQSMVVPMGMSAGGAGQAAVLTPTHLNAMANKAALASAKFSIFNELIQGGSTRLLNFGKNTQWTGRQLMVGFTLPLVMFTAVVSKQFREIDKELTRFEKVYGADLVGTVEGSTKKMREQVKQLAFEISSAYGIAAKDTAALAADIAQTGKEGQALIDSVRQTTRLAVLGEVERQEAMRATLSIQNAFKLNTNELAESIDFLNAVENETSTNLQDLAGAIPRVGPVIQALGGDIKDMSLLLVAMREGGVSAAEGANALKSGLGRLINPTRAARDMAASFGISLQSIIDSSRGELLPMVFGLQDALSGLDDFAKAQVIEKIFGKYQFARMSALFANLRRQGSQTLTVMELASASSTELAGIANKELRALQESTAMRFQRTIENLKNSLIPLGQTLTETMIPILSAIGGGIKSFLEFFQSLPEPVKNFTKYAVTLTALAGPVVMLVGLFGNLIANGIKFAMAIVRIGAKIAGLRFEKFELLTAETIAAKTGVDNLTTAFTTQEAAIKRLSGVMAAYEASLRRLSTTNPALFIPGAIPGRGIAPIRRSKGSTSPETVPGGYGGGDVVPALLEPGEFVVRKEAAAKNKNFLRALNRGQVRGYAFGDEVGPLPASKYSAPSETRKALIHPAQQARMEEVVDEIARRAGVVFTNDNQRNDAVKIHLTHLERDIRNNVKYFDPANLLLATGAENQALEQLTGQGKTARRAVISLMNEFAANDPEARRVRDSLLLKDSSGNITEVRQPRTREQMALFSRVLDRMLENPNDKRIWGRSATTKTVWAPLFRAILNERITGGGRLLPTEIPMARDVARSILSARISPLSIEEAARRSISGVPSEMQRPVGTGPRPPIQPILPRGRFGMPLRVQPGELFIPRSVFADNGAVVNRDGSVSPLRIAPSDPRSALMQRLAMRAGRGGGGMGPVSVLSGASGTGPQDNLSKAQAAAPGAMKGMGLMNIAFASSMIVSSMSMAGGASNDLAIKLGLLSGAVMTAAAMMQMFAGKNVMGNFLGLGSAGSKMTAAGVAAQRAAIAQHGSAAAARAAGAGGAGAGLLRGGAALSMLGGPVGIAAAAAVTAGVAGYMMYMKAAEQARERAMAAFADPAKTAEYFGITVEDVTEKLKGVSAALPGIEEVDLALRESVKQDYATLIEKIRYGGAEAGARELGIVFNNMLTSGLSEEQAREAVKAIAIESGAAGGQAYAQALRQNLFSEKTAEEIAKSTARMFDPGQQESAREAAQRTLDAAEDAVGRTGRITGALAQAMDNFIGTGLLNVTSFGLGMLSIDFDTVQAKEAIENAAAVERQIHQMQTGIEEMSDVTGDQIVQITELLFENFKDAPRETIDAFRDIAEAGKRSTEIAFDTKPIKDFISEIDPINGIILNAIIGDNEEMAMLVSEGIIAMIPAYEIANIIQTAIEEGVDPEEALRKEIEVRIKITDISNTLDDLQNELQEDLVLDLDIKIEEGETKLGKINKILEGMDEARERFEKRLNKNWMGGDVPFNKLQRQSEKSIESMENQIDAIRDAEETRREQFDERMDEYNKEKEQISESTDAYIESLRKRERADNFYSNQRKTAFSAMQKLAAGDVFGFLQEREQMSADAQTFAYENTIQDVEDKKDREIDAIDTVMEKEQERQEKYEKDAENRIELIENQIDAERDLMDERQKAFDKEMKNFDRKQNRRRRDLEDEKSELLVSLDDLRATRNLAESKTLVDAKSLSKALGEEKARPYIEQQKEILKTAMMEQYMIKKSEFPDEDEDSWKRRAYQEIDDLFAILFGKTSSGIRSGSRELSAMLDEIGFNTNFNTGGSVKGPGTPTSDSIPARLSDGEYVVRASSVKKYGTDLMDAINVGKFRTGGYVSADRAETAANNNVYAGGWKPKPAYSGGTPTSSTGYSTANSQASSNIYGKGKKKSPYTRGGYSRGYGSGRAGAGFSLFGKSISEGISQRGLGGFLSDMVSSIAANPLSIMPFYGLNSIDTSTQEGKDMQQAAALMEILGVLPGIGIPFKGISMAGRTGAKVTTSTVLNTPPPSSSLGNLFSLNMGMNKARTASSTVKPTVAKGPLGDSVLLEWVRRYVDEDPLDNVFDKVVAGSQGGISPGGWVIGKDGVRRYVKGQYDSHAGARSVYLEALIANAYDSLGMNVPKINLLNIGQTPRPFPGNPTVDMTRGSIIPADEFLQRAPWTNYTPGQLITSSEMLDNVKHIAGFYGKADTGVRPVDALGNPSGLTFAEQQLDRSMRATLAKEGGIGKAVDTLFGLRDTHSGNYVITENASIPLGVPGRFNPYRIDFGSNAFQTPGGRPLPFDPSNPLKISDPAYGKTYGFGNVSRNEYVKQVLRLQEMLGDTGGIGGLIDPILFKFADSAPQHKLSNPDFLKFVLKERLRAMVADARGIDHVPPLRYKDGGPVELKKSLDKWIPKDKLSYYSNWDKFGSWPGGVPRGLMMHHTAGVGPGVLDWMARHPEAGKPVVQAMVSRAGVAHILAHGGTGWGAGVGGTSQLKDPKYAELAKDLNNLGGASNILWQVEVESQGLKQDFTDGMFDTIARMTAAIKEYSGWNSFSGKIINHKDWAPGRKNDTLYPASLFENNAQRIWTQGGGTTESDSSPEGGKNKSRKSGEKAEEILFGTGSGTERMGFGKVAARYLMRQLLPGKNNNGENNNGSGNNNGTPGNRGLTLDPNDYAGDVINGYNLVRLLYGSGWRNKDDIRTAYGVVMGESNGYRKAKNDNWAKGSKGIDWGLWQINDYWHKNVGGETIDYSPGRIFDAIYNSKIAYGMWKDPKNHGGASQTPWGGWNAHRDQTSQYRLGLQTFDNNPGWWSKLVTETGGSNGKPKKFAMGGSVFGPGGPTSDSIPAMLSNGEYVVNADSVKRYGRGFLDKINSGQLGNTSVMPNGFAGGGFVSPSYNVPVSNDLSSSQLMNSINNMSVQGNSSTSNRNNIKIVVNGSGSSAKSVANQVVRMINSATDRRNHSRSIS